MPGDFIRAIDGKPTREMSVFEGSRVVRGAPGSKVTLTVIRSNTAEPHQIEIVREALPAAQVTARVAAGGVGYLRIPAFTAETAGEVRAKIADLQSSGATRFAIDIRSCAAGPLETGLAVARLFVASGTLAVYEQRGAPKEPVAAAAGDGALALPAVVLIDAGTSGAAELFAAALSGNARADLVGERTHGRVVVLRLALLPDGSALLVPNAWYLSPSGVAIQDKGLVPDAEVDVPNVEFGAPAPAGDLILAKALERLAGKPKG
jgi:carboxyl-terminal processing protease